MKSLKLVLLAAIVFCSVSIFSCPEVFASDIYNNENIQQVDPDYVVVSIEDLSAEVQAAVKEIEAEFNVVKIEFNKESELTRLTVADKDESSNVNLIYLNVKGEKVLPSTEKKSDLNPKEDVE